MEWKQGCIVVEKKFELKLTCEKEPGYVARLGAAHLVTIYQLMVEEDISNLTCNCTSLLAVVPSNHRGSLAGIIQVNLAFKYALYHNF